MDNSSDSTSTTDSSSSADDTFTESSHIGFGQKLMSSIVGMLIGFLLVVGSIVGLFWNEGRAVTTARSLTEGAGIVQSVDSARVATENEGKLVHVVGQLATSAPLSDPELLVSTKAAVLLRHVEMFQWDEDKSTETRKNFGGSEERVTTYTYKRTWSSRRIDSSRFKQASTHQNPQMRYQARTVLARDATLGAYRPGDAALRRLKPTEVLHIDPAQAGALQKQVSGARVHVVDGVVYIGADPANPAVGDYRITFKVAREGTATFMGRQSGTDLAPYQTKAGDALLFARPGSVSAAEIISEAQADNRILTWIIRAICVVLMLVGFALLSGPLVALADVVPLLGSLLGSIGFVMALVMTMVTAPTVIAIAWFWHRPLVSAAVLGGGLVLAFLARKLMPARAPQKQTSFLPPGTLRPAR